MHADLVTLDAGLAHVRQSPSDHGRLGLIVVRPAEGARETPERARLDAGAGLVGDRWAGGQADLARELTIMNIRAVELVAGPRERWPLAGDQLYLDLDLSATNLPPGTRLALGSAVVEVTAAPHLGCKKFQARFGLDALRWVNSDAGKELKLRGVNARVIQPGEVRLGDTARKLALAATGEEPADTDGAS